jgi:hypothetical protein
MDPNGTSYCDLGFLPTNIGLGVSCGSLDSVGLPVVDIFTIVDTVAYWDGVRAAVANARGAEAALLGTSTDRPGGSVLSVGLYAAWLANAAVVNGVFSRYGQTAVIHYPVSIRFVSATCSSSGNNFSASAVLDVTYQVLDQFGNPWNPSDGQLWIHEIIQDTGGPAILGGNGWVNYNNGQSNRNTIDGGGYFMDELTQGGLFPSSTASTALQAFYGTGGFFDMPLIVNFGGTTYGILGNYYSATNVLINGTNPASGGCR